MPKAKMKRKGAPASAMADLAVSDLPVRFWDKTQHTKKGNAPVFFGQIVNFFQSDFPLRSENLQTSHLSRNQKRRVATASLTCQRRWFVRYLIWGEIDLASRSNLLRFLHICLSLRSALWSKCVATSGLSSSTLGNNLIVELVLNFAMARFWRRILMHTVEWEPGLRDFLPDFSSLDRQVSFYSNFHMYRAQLSHILVSICTVLCTICPISQCLSGTEPRVLQWKGFSLIQAVVGTAESQTRLCLVICSLTLSVKVLDPSIR